MGRNRAGYLSACSLGLLVLLQTGSLAYTPSFSDKTKLRWQDAFFDSTQAIPRQHLLILLQDTQDPTINDSCKAMIYPKETAGINAKSLITREQLMQGVLAYLPSYLYQRAESAVFSDLPASYAGLNAVDWFFRSQLPPDDWRKAGKLDVFRPVTYAEAAEFAEKLKLLVSADRPPYAVAYVPSPSPPSADTYFSALMASRKTSSLLELKWKGKPEQRPLFVEVNLASWGLLSHVTVYDDGTYGDQVENDGIYGLEINGNAVPKQNAYVDVIFNTAQSGDIYGRLNLP